MENQKTPKKQRKKEEKEMKMFSSLAEATHIYNTYISLYIKVTFNCIDTCTSVSRRETEEGIVYRYINITAGSNNPINLINSCPTLLVQSCVSIPYCKYTYI